MRKLAAVELLSTHRLERVKDVRVSEVETLVKDLYSLCKSNEHMPVKVVINEWIECLTFNIITTMIAGKRYFGSDHGGNADGEEKLIGKIIEEFMYVSGVLVISDLTLFLGFLNPLLVQVKQMKQIAKELDSSRNLDRRT